VIKPPRSDRLRVPQAVLRDTFTELRRCGAGLRECQVLWTGPWARSSDVTTLVHPAHRSHAGGFELDSAWLTSFWQKLTQTASGIRAQVHTHPGRAFHSPTDDAWPIIHTPGFLSLVIPNFAAGDVGFTGAFLTEIGENGQWREVSAPTRIEVVTS
jgi:hypothetical protein